MHAAGPLETQESCSGRRVALICRFVFIAIAALLRVSTASLSAESIPTPEQLPGTAQLTATGDLATAMVAGMDEYLRWQTHQSVVRARAVLASGLRFGRCLSQVG